MSSDRAARRLQILSSPLTALPVGWFGPSVPKEWTQDRTFDAIKPAQESGKRVLILRPVLDTGLRLIRQAGHKITLLNETRFTPEQIIAAVKHYKADALMSVCDTPITEKVFRECAGQLKIVAQYAVGFDNIDLKAAKKYGVAVSNTPGVLTDATADSAWSLMIAASRRIVAGDQYVRDNKFKRFETTVMLGPTFAGKTLGVFGFGRIGQAVAQRGLGFGMKIIYHDVNRLPEAVENKYHARYVSFEELCRQADFISCHCNLTPATRQSFTKKAFAMMKPTTIFVNNSRGPVISEADLAEALATGKIAGAGIDVFEKEPQVHPALLALPKEKITLAPHLGSATWEARSAMSRMVGQSIVACLAGAQIPNRIA